jgi:hypothetical protein
MLRMIFEPQRQEVKGDWRKLHNEELHGFYCSTDILSGDEINVKKIFITDSCR